jgi:hypothetical protein
MTTTDTAPMSAEEIERATTWLEHAPERSVAVSPAMAALVGRIIRVQQARIAELEKHTDRLDNRIVVQTDRIAALEAALRTGLHLWGRACIGGDAARWLRAAKATLGD